MSRILLLEDDEALGRGICMALETPNCTVTHCSTRLQAIKILQGVVFDLLILDINLPDGSGLELLRTLRQNGTSTPAILLTANDLELDEVTGLEAGADELYYQAFLLGSAPGQSKCPTAALCPGKAGTDRIERFHPRLHTDGVFQRRDNHRPFQDRTAPVAPAGGEPGPHVTKRIAA